MYETMHCVLNVRPTPGVSECVIHVTFFFILQRTPIPKEVLTSITQPTFIIQVCTFRDTKTTRLISN